MFEIRKLQFIIDNGNVALEVSSVPFPFNELFSRWGTTPFVILDACSVDRKKYPAAQQMLDHICLFGWMDEAGKYHMPVAASSGQIRTGSFVMIEKEAFDNIWEWLTIGIPKEKLAVLGVSKVAKYVMLAMSSVHPWREIFSDTDEIIPGFTMANAMPEPDPANFAVLSDIDKLVKSVVDEVAPRNYKRAVAKSVKLKITDGAAYYIVHDEQWSDEARAAFRKRMEAFTFRGPFLKGCMLPILATDLRLFFMRHHFDGITKDVWGNETYLLNKQVITFGSVMKCWKCISSIDEYAERCKRYNRSIFVCVVAHTRTADMPYQQMQTLALEQDEVNRLVEGAVGELEKSAAEFRLSGRHIGPLLSIYPALANEQFVHEEFANAYLRRLVALAGGKLPRCGRNPFVLPDTLAVLSAIIGENKTYIPAKKVICSIYKDGQEVSVTRNPHLDHAHCLRTVFVPDKRLAGFYAGGACFISAEDVLMLAVQADFDGDHVFITKSETVRNAAKRGFKKYGNHVLEYSACDAGGVKAFSNYQEEFAEKCRTIEAAPIGLYVNTLTKVYANEGYTLDKVAALTRKANTCIDEAGGHGTDASDCIADDIVSSYRKVKKPRFLWYAKKAKVDGGVIVGNPKDDEKFKFYANSMIERYSDGVLKKAKRSVDEVVDFAAIGEFDWKMLLCDNTVDKVPAVKGIIDWFEDIAFGGYSEREEIRTNRGALLSIYDEDFAASVQESLCLFAKEHKYSLQQCIDYLIRVLFDMRKSERFVRRNAIVKRAFFVAFDQLLFKNLATNLGLGPVDGFSLISDFFDTEDTQIEE